MVDAAGIITGTCGCGKKSDAEGVDAAAKAFVHPSRTDNVRVYKLLDQVPLLRAAFAARGWIEHDDRMPPDAWSICWKGTRFLPSDYRAAHPHQRLNHLIGSAKVTRKDLLLRALRKLRAVHGRVYALLPEAFLLPTEYTKFLHHYSQQDGGLWICKPTDSSRGRNIFLLRDLRHLTYDMPILVQRYVDRPLTVGGYKFDLRLYVLVTSVHPLEVLLYSADGLVRFATHKYPTDPQSSDLSNLYSHLTNSSINKHSERMADDKDVIGEGCKWTLTQLQAHIEREMCCGAALWRIMWSRIVNVVTLASFTLLQNVPTTPQPAFELFGLDVMVDEDWRPWLLEINCTPSLYKDCEADEAIKLPMLTDLIQLLEGGEDAREAQPQTPPSPAAATTAPRGSVLKPTQASSRRGVAKTQPPKDTPEWPCPVQPDEEGSDTQGPWDAVCGPRKVGGWERVFPSSRSSLDASLALCEEMKRSKAACSTTLQQQHFRVMVAEVREREKRLQQELRGIKAQAAELKTGGPGVGLAAGQQASVTAESASGISHSEAGGTGLQAARKLRKDIRI